MSEESLRYTVGSVVAYLPVVVVFAIFLWGRLSRREGASRRALRVLGWMWILAFLWGGYLGVTGWFGISGGAPDETVEPAVKARLLAEGIAAVMNGTALMIVGTVLYVPMWWFLRRDIRRESEGPRDKGGGGGDISQPYSPPGGDSESASSAD